MMQPFPVLMDLRDATPFAQRAKLGHPALFTKAAWQACEIPPEHLKPKDDPKDAHDALVLYILRGIKPWVKERDRAILPFSLSASFGEIELCAKLEPLGKRGFRVIVMTAKEYLEEEAREQVDGHINASMIARQVGIPGRTYFTDALMDELLHAAPPALIGDQAYLEHFQSRMLSVLIAIHRAGEKSGDIHKLLFRREVDGRLVEFCVMHNPNLGGQPWTLVETKAEREAAIARLHPDGIQKDAPRYVAEPAWRAG